MYEPGIDRHDWESQWEALEEDVHADPANALPELDLLVARMLAETGYDLTDPVARDGGEREVVADYLAAHEILEAMERDSVERLAGGRRGRCQGLSRRLRPAVATRGAIDARLGLADLDRSRRERGLPCRRRRLRQLDGPLRRCSRGRSRTSAA